MALSALLLCLALAALAPVPTAAFHAAPPALPALRARGEAGARAKGSFRRGALQGVAPGMGGGGLHPLSLRAVLSQETSTATQVFTVEAGDKVRVAFCGKTDDGEIVVKSAQGEADKLFKTAKAKGPEPMKEEFSIGGGEVARACEEALLGLKEGDVATVRLSPAEAYGEHDEDLEYTITKDMVGMPEDMPFPVGTTFKLKGGLEARVIEEDGKWVVLDANHELSGRDITFNIMVHEIWKQGCDSPLCEIEEIDFLQDS